MADPYFKASLVDLLFLDQRWMDEASFGSAGGMPSDAQIGLQE